MLKSIAILTIIVFIGCTTPSNVQFKDITVAEFKSKMHHDNTIILDVRTPAETSQGTIEGAQLLDYKAEDFATKIDALDKSKTYLVYCRSGGRSSGAAKLMQEKGFRDIYNLKGGYKAWNKE